MGLERILRNKKVWKEFSKYPFCKGYFVVGSYSDFSGGGKLLYNPSNDWFYKEKEPFIVPLKKECEDAVEFLMWGSHKHYKR